MYHIKVFRHPNIGLDNAVRVRMRDGCTVPGVALEGIHWWKVLEQRRYSQHIGHLPGRLMAYGPNSFNSLLLCHTLEGAHREKSLSYSCT